MIEEMSSHLVEIFEDEKLVEKIKRRLPYLFQLAESESSRAGRTGMEVGSVRERIIVAMLIYKFGQDNVQTEIPITEPEIDAKVFGKPVSIKTFTGKGFTGVKIKWTVDAQKAKEFLEEYYPLCDILLVRINWGGMGEFYYIPLEVQKKIFDNIGIKTYIKPPKLGTNPRGPEFTKEALSKLAGDTESKNIIINWERTKIDYNPYKRWVELWRED